MKTALLNGSNGFIGQNLKKRLLDLNFFIIEINEDAFQSETWEIDIKKSLDFHRPEVIFHVGACSDTLESDVNKMMFLNFEVTKFLVDTAKLNHYKFIYSSSAANYGNHNKFPSNLYGWSKYVAEQYVISNGGVGLRYFNVYGPKEEHKGRMASIAFQFFIKNLKGEKCKLFPKKPLRDFVYVDDVVDANIHAYDNYNDVKSNWYDVGFGEARSFEEVLACFNINFSYALDSEIPKGYQFFTCSDKSKFLPKWNPKHSIEVGLAKYKEYLEYNFR
jgi:ADP-L-glycero-D-manno-heptose 6-epimerase